MSTRALLLWALAAPTVLGIAGDGSTKSATEDAVHSLAERGYRVLKNEGRLRHWAGQSIARAEVSLTLSELGITLSHHPNHVFSEGFDADLPDSEWEISGDPTWGTTDYKPEPFDTGSRAWCAAGGSKGSSPEDADYQNGMHALMVYGPFNLKKAGAAELSFSVWLKTELNHDWVFVLASRNGDEFTGFGASGDSQGWISLRATFNDFSGFGSLIGEEQVWLAFSFTSDSAVTDRGAFIDGIDILRSDWKKARTGDLADVAFPGAENGVIVGDHGTLLRTVNGGASWGRTAIETANPLYAVSFPDVAHGWVSGGGSFIAATSDGGANWSRQESGIAIAQLYDVHFVSPDTGWVVGLRGSALFPTGRLVLRTFDGGTTWISALNTGGNGGELHGVHFVDSEVGWAVGVDEGSLILRSADGGRLWTRQEAPTASRLEAIHFQDRNRGWAVGLGGTILRTQDGGANWTPQESGTVSALTDVVFIDGTGWITAGTFLLRSLDGGESWERIDIGAATVVQGIDFGPDGTGWLAGWGGTVLTSHDQGNSWTELAGNTGVNVLDLNGVRFVGANTAVVVGQAGAVIRSADGGATWRRVNTPVTEALASVFFLDNLTGWSVGARGTIIKTTDGGVSWSDYSMEGSLSALTEVFFISPSTGWASSANGKIFRSEDGGTTWTEKYSNPAYALWSIGFQDERHGWAVGLRGRAIETTDGGDSWTPRDVGDRDDLRRIRFRTTHEGWIAGAGGTLLRTRDGGNTWESISTGVQATLEDVLFLNADVGWIVGFDGTVLRSDDGGEHWMRQTVGTFDRLFSVDFTDGSRGLVVGASGTIAQTDNSGVFTRTESSSGELPVRAGFVALYPNPLFDMLNMEYEVTDPGRIVIRLFNLLGQELQTLLDADRLPGHYAERVRLAATDGRRLSSGIYLARLTAARASDTRTLVVVR